MIDIVENQRVDPSSPDDFRHKLKWRMGVKPAGFSKKSKQRID